MGLINFIQDNYNIVLVSSSPRRKQLLSNFGFKFNIVLPDFDEDSFVDEVPRLYCEGLSIAKIESIRSEHYNTPSIFIAADTIVVLDDDIINKPRDRTDAISILKKLSGKPHTVITGLTLFNNKNNRIITRSVDTVVYFRDLEHQEIVDYVDTGSPLDKAGGYGIQDDYGAFFVSRIEGCYYNVVGLPMATLYDMLRDIVSS